MCKRCRRDDKVRPDPLGLPWCYRCGLPVLTAEEEAMSVDEVLSALLEGDQCTGTKTSVPTS